MLADVEELLAEYDDGAHTWDGMMTSILDLSRRHAIDDVIEALREPWRTDFVAWAREHFDTDTPAHEFVFFHVAVPTPKDFEPIVRIRQWLACHPLESPTRRAIRQVLADLTVHGVLVADTQALQRLSREQYQQAVPVLVSWLPRVRDAVAKDWLVRALSVSAAGVVACRALLEELRARRDWDSDITAWAIANGIECTATPKVFDDIAAVLADRRHGKAREMLALALAKTKDPRAVPILIDLLGDEVVVGHAVIGLHKLRATEAADKIKPLLDHPKTWIRTAAKKALARFDSLARRGR